MQSNKSLPLTPNAKWSNELRRLLPSRRAGCCPATPSGRADTAPPGSARSLHRPPAARSRLRSPPPHRRDRHQHQHGHCRGCRRLPAPPAPGTAPLPPAWCSPCCRRAAPASSSLPPLLPPCPPSFLPSGRPPFRAPRREKVPGRRLLCPSGSRDMCLDAVASRGAGTWKSVKCVTA